MINEQQHSSHKSTLEPLSGFWQRLPSLFLNLSLGLLTCGLIVTSLRSLNCDKGKSEIRPLHSILDGKNRFQTAKTLSPQVPLILNRCKSRRTAHDLEVSIYYYMYMYLACIAQQQQLRLGSGSSAPAPTRVLIRKAGAGRPSLPASHHAPMSPAELPERPRASVEKEQALRRHYCEEM